MIRVVRGERVFTLHSFRDFLKMLSNFRISDAPIDVQNLPEDMTGGAAESKKQ